MEALGIEPKLLLAQVVNFLIIVVVLNVLLYKPILSILEKRKKEIAEGLEYTEKIRHEFEVMEQKKAKMLADSRKEGQGIIEEARLKGKAEGKMILDEAREEAEEIVEKGKISVLQEREAMQKGLRKDSVALAILIAKRLLSEILTADMQHKILAKHMKAIENV
jgi:F-type H+-transporting ATPase subunit b